MFQYNLPLSCFALLYIRQNCSLNQSFQKQCNLPMSIYRWQNNVLPILLKDRAPISQNTGATGAILYWCILPLIYEKNLDSKYIYFAFDLNPLKWTKNQTKLHYFVLFDLAFVCMLLSFMYAFQSESKLFGCLTVKELLARNRRDIWSLSDNYGIRFVVWRKGQ